MGKLSIIDRVRIALAGWAFLLAGRLWPEIFAVWQDVALRSEPRQPTLDEGLRIRVQDILDDFAKQPESYKGEALRVLRAALAAQERETP